MTDKRRRVLFRKLVHEQSAEMYRFAFWRTGEAEAAEDLVQETYLEAWRSIGRLRKPDRARAWILQILRHRFAHWVRAKQRRPEADSTLGVVEHRVADRADPARDIDLRLDLAKALGQVDDRYREAFLLVFQQGLTCREAAEILDVPLGTVLSRIHRAREGLRGLLTASGRAGGGRVPPTPLRLLREEERHDRQ